MNLNYRVKFLKSEAWKTMRAAALAKYHCKCAVCGIKHISNDVHHIQYRLKSSQREQVNDLRVLCRRCHILMHSYIDRHKKVVKRAGCETAWNYLVRKCKKQITLRGEKLLSRNLRSEPRRKYTRSSVPELLKPSRLTRCQRHMHNQGILGIANWLIDSIQNLPLSPFEIRFVATHYIENHDLTAREFAERFTGLLGLE